MMLCSVVFLPFSTSFMSQNIGTLVPVQLYNLSLIAAGLLNIRLVRMVTAPPVVSEAVSAERIAIVRARGPAVVLGGLCAMLVAFWDPRFSQMALVTIPLWLRLLRAWTMRRLARAPR